MKPINCFIKKIFEEREERVNKTQRMKTSGNYTHFITTDKDRYVLRLNGDGWRYKTPEEIKSEVKLLKFLCSHSILVPNPIKISNSFVISFGGRNGILYKYLDAEPVVNPNLYNCFVVGESLAKMHKLTENFKFPNKRRNWDLEATKETFEELKEKFRKNSCLKKHKFAENIQCVLDELKFPKKLPKCAIHEDLGRRHVLFKNSEIYGILDFDRSYFGFSVLDLGQAARGWCFDNWIYWNEEKFKFLLMGYKSQRKLTKLEREYLLDSIKFGILERVIAYGYKFVYTKNEEDVNFAIHSLINLIPQVKL